MFMVLSHGKLKSLEGSPKKSVPATTRSGSKISTPGSGRKGNPKKRHIQTWFIGGLGPLAAQILPRRERDGGLEGPLGRWLGGVHALLSRITLGWLLGLSRVPGIKVRSAACKASTLVYYHSGPQLDFLVFSKV